MTYSFDLFISFGILSLLLFAGVLLRKMIPILQRWMIPACMLGGILGFLFINSGFTSLRTSSFQEITYHVFNLSYMSLVLTPSSKGEKKKKSAFRGGLWMALISSMILSVQGLAGALAYAFTNLTGLTKQAPVWLGFLITHGFTQGTGQALAVGNSWEAFGIQNAANVGLFYAAVGFLLALLIGVPYANWAKRNKKTVIPEKDMKSGILKGLYPKENQVSAGMQTTHPDNIDTLSYHLAILGICYFLTYLLASFLSNQVLASSGALKVLPFSLFFLPGMFVCLFVKQVLKMLKLDHTIHMGIQSRITGFCVDYLMVASMTSISFSLLLPYIPGILTAILFIGTGTFFLIRFFSSKLPGLRTERFLCQLGCCMGNTASGLLLLRQVDPDYETSCAMELVVFNILLVLTAFIYLLAPVAPKFGIMAWALILTGNGVLMVILLWIFGFLKSADRKEA